MFNKVAVIGVGLIGGSLARVLKDGNLAGEVVGFGRQIDNLQRAVDLGVIDRACASVTDAVKDADLVVLATPAGAVEQILTAIAPVLGEATVITDVSSTKARITKVAKKILKENFAYFVPGHPVAGREESGVAASSSELFKNHLVVLTPVPETRKTAISRVQNLWELAGARVTTLEPGNHDEIFAACSHVPHVLAFMLVDLLVRQDNHKAVFEYSAGGFRDFTRIAASDPAMWRDICLENGSAITSLLRQYQNEIKSMINAIETASDNKLLEIFERAKHARDQYLKNNNSHEN